MAESFSFDVVSDFERQELVNTLDQVKREVSQRYDLKGTDTTVELDKEKSKYIYHKKEHDTSEFKIRPKSNIQQKTTPNRSYPNDKKSITWCKC